LRDLRSVHVGAYGIESNARLRIPHFGLKERGAGSSHHFTKWFTPLFLANEFDSFRDVGEVRIQASLQKRALVWEVLI